MSTIEDVAGVQITSNTSFPTPTDFETICIATTHAFWVDPVKLVSNLDELTDLAVPTYAPMYKCLAAMRRNSSMPKRFLIGKRLLPSTQIVKLTPKDTTVGYVYRWTVTTPDGVAHELTYTVQSGDDLQDVSDGIAAQIDPLADVAAVSATLVTTCTSTAGKLLEYSDLPPIAKLEVQDTSTNPGIETDLAAIKIAAREAGYGFFGVVVDHNAEAIIKAAATWVDSQNLCAGFQASDSGIVQPGVTTDVASDMKAASNKKCFGLFSQQSTGDFRAAQLLADCLSYTPGTYNLAHKSLTGITADKLLDGERASIEAKNWSWYAPMGGLPDTFEGHTPNSSWFDIEIGKMWQSSRIQARVFGYLRSKPIVPYTDFEILHIAGLVRAALAEGQRTGFLSSEIDPVVSVVPLAEIPPDVQASRRLTNVISFSATYGNAINGVVTKGVLAYAGTVTV